MKRLRCRRCGHRWDEHHLGCVGNREYGEATGESYVPQECEHFGSNEMGGRDAEGANHCWNYHDTLADEQPTASQ